MASQISTNKVFFFFFDMLHMPSLLIVNFSFRIVKHIYNIGFIFLQEKLLGTPGVP